MKPRCILCGREYENENIRPGSPVQCNLHDWKDLGSWGTFTVDEARREGERRVSSISPEEIMREGLLAHAELEKWEQELANPKVHGALRQYTLGVIAMKKAYLSAFD